MHVLPAALILLLAWSLFAFGGVYAWALTPIVAVSVGGAVIVRLTRARPRLTLDVWLLLTVFAGLLQLVPLPPSLRQLLAPHQTEYIARTSLLPEPDAWMSLSLVPGQWLFGAGALIAAVAVFCWTRDGFESRGVRRLARSVAWMGMAVSILALVQPAFSSAGQIYGFWTPEASGAEPIGPIVSRNHFAAWIVLAWPLTVGYLVAHGRTHWTNRRVSRGVLVLGDTRAIWLALAAALMVASLLVTQSRAGTLGFFVAATMLGLLVWRRIGSAGRIGMVGFLVTVALAVSLWASPAALLGRIEGAYSGADGGRPAIWDQTMVLVRTFPLAGIGLGTFDVVMPAYQTQSFDTLLNHAHNQYLHVQAEGGLLVVIPLGVSILLIVGTAIRRLRQDSTPIIHVRHGAIAGLTGLAALSVFEVPLLTPAVLLLAAVSAALAVRGPDTPPAPSGDEVNG
jgi:O-antigen ligase